jgi:hypothetical protein
MARTARRQQPPAPPAPRIVSYCRASADMQAEEGHHRQQTTGLMSRSGAPCRPRSGLWRLLALLAALSGPASEQESPPAPGHGPWVVTPVTPAQGLPMAWLHNSLIGEVYICIAAAPPQKTPPPSPVMGACVPLLREPFPQIPPRR